MDSTERIRRLVDEAPPLTELQRNRLAALLMPALDPEPRITRARRQLPEAA